MTRRLSSRQRLAGKVLLTIVQHWIDDAEREAPEDLDFLCAMVNTLDYGLRRLRFVIDTELARRGGSGSSGGPN